MQGAGRARPCGGTEKSAIAILEHARRIEPDNAELIARLVDAHAILRNESQARPLIAEAVKRMPTNREVAPQADAA